MRVWRRKLVKLANSARDEMRKGNMQTPISTRSLVLFSEAYADYTADGISDDDAIQGAFGNFVVNVAANPTDHVAICSMIQRLFSLDMLAS